MEKAVKEENRNGSCIIEYGYRFYVESNEEQRLYTIIHFFRKTLAQ